MHDALYLTQYREAEYAANASHFIAQREHELQTAALKAKARRVQPRRRLFARLAALRLPLIHRAPVAASQ